jgi:hypothetical protein
MQCIPGELSRVQKSPLSPIWAMGGRGPTFAGDAGDVADACRATAALVRSGGCEFVNGPFGQVLRATANAEMAIAQPPPGVLPVGPTAPWTISFWHRTRTSISLANSFGFGALTNATTGAGRLVIQADNNYYLLAWGADWNTGVAWDADNVWHHVAFTSDGAFLRFYRDGVLAAGPIAITYDAAAGDNILVFGQPLAIAPDMDLGVPQIYDFALSASAIADIYANPNRAFASTARTRRRYSPPTSTSTIFRRTTGPVRIGSRSNS